MLLAAGWTGRKRIFDAAGCKEVAAQGVCVGGGGGGGGQRGLSNA